MSDKTYNGWSNYETWNVKLWMDNEQGTQEYWRDMAREQWEYPQKTSPHWSNSEAARFSLADMLKDHYEEALMEVLTPEHRSSVWSDLLGAALSEVDWQEIADNLLSDEDLSDDETGEKYEPAE